MWQLLSLKSSDIDWDPCAVRPDASDKAVQQALIDVMNSFNLTQVQRDPTREGDPVYLLAGSVYSFGRKDCDVILQNDPSISRKHAYISVNHVDKNLNQPQLKPELIVKDASKLGCVVREERFRNEERPLNDGDTILFGTQGDSTYVVRYEPLVVTTSCISASSEKRAVGALVLRLGGHQVSEWRPECSLLVMSNLSVTVKVICALVAQRHIVTPQYLEDLVKACEKKSPLPDCTKYLPPLAESQLDPTAVSFAPLPARKALLRGKTFVFLSAKQHKKLQAVIELAGGATRLLEDSAQDSLLLTEGTCVMAADATESATQMTQNSREVTKRVAKLLRRNKKRMITDPEIGYAVLFCSTEKHCNPDAPLTDMTNPGSVSQSLSQAPEYKQEQPAILAPNTVFNTTIAQRRADYSRADVTHVYDTEAFQNVDKSRRSIGAAVATTSRNETPGRKRPIEDEQTEPPAKKQAPQITIKQEMLSQDVPGIGQLVSRHPRSNETSPQPPGDTNQTRTNTKPALQQVVKEPLPNTTNTGRDRRGNTMPHDDDFSTTRTHRHSPPPQVVDMDEKPVLAGHSDFDSIPARGSRRQRGSNATSTQAPPGDFGDITVRRPRRESNALESAGTAVEEIPVKRRRRDGAAPERNEETVDCVTQNTSAVQPVVKQDVVNRTITNLQTNDEFLAKKDPKFPGVAISEFNKAEDEQVGCVLVEERSLLARKPGERIVRPVSGNSGLWKGKVVKNFKRFAKAHRNLAGLPTIIGGSDLVVYEVKDKAELDDWFREQSQADESQAKADSEINSFFKFSDDIQARKRRR